MITGNLLSLATGLSIGLFIAFLVYLHGNPPGQLPDLKATPQKAPSRQVKSKDIQQQQKSQSLPEPKFDFYKILPNREVNISEWIAKGQEREKTARDDTSLYVFQVGSFKQYKAADQVKATLALAGINAGIQRVVINGQDARYRVRVGPYKDPKLLRETRNRLEDNHMDFMLLKLKIEDIKAAGE